MPDPWQQLDGTKLRTIELVGLWNVRFRADTWDKENVPPGFNAYCKDGPEAMATMWLEVRALNEAVRRPRPEEDARVLNSAQDSTKGLLEFGSAGWFQPLKMD